MRLTLRLFSLLVLVAAVTGSGGTASAHRSTGPHPLVSLPADQAAHPAAHNEWWYVVGHLASGNHRFGYEVTIFRFDHVKPPGFSVPITIFRTDVAITDESAKRFHQRIRYYFPQSAHISSRTLDARVGTASLSGASLDSMRLRAALPGGSIDLQLHSNRPPMYVGGRGYLKFGDGFTYYYSLTGLAARGRLEVGGKRYDVQGISWLDHQWGNWQWATVRGWTWMALQLDNGVQMSIFDVDSAAGRQRAASVLLANGTLRTIRSIQVTHLSTWRSPHTGRIYPSGWVVTVPSLHARFTITPTVKNQELTVPGQPAQLSYWEGSGRLTGTFMGKPVKGYTYTELTGNTARPATKP